MLWFIRVAVVIAAVGLGMLVGFGAVMLLYEIANPAHSPKDGVGMSILATALGLPCGGVVGLVAGLLVAVRFVKSRARGTTAKVGKGAEKV